MRDKQNFSSNAASGKAWKDLFGERVLNFSIDFTQKLSISLREAKETIYWLKVIKSLNFVSIKEVDKLISEAEEIAAILVSGVKKSKQKQLKKEI